MLLVYSLMWFRLIQVQLASVLLFACMSCSRCTNVDQNREMQVRRDVQNVFYAIAMAVDDDKDKPIQEILDSMVLEKGKHFFLTENDASPIYVNLDQAKWDKALRQSEGIAVFTAYRTSAGEEFWITKSFSGESGKVRKEAVGAIQKEKFWNVNMPSTSPGRNKGR